MLPIYNYDAYIFDCDGVILDSNELKIDAMDIALKSIIKNTSEIDACVDYFRHNFGRSRFHHVDVFVDNYLSIAEKEIDNTRATILDAYSSQCTALYLLADITPGFIEFITQLKGNKYVASGSEQEELRGVFKTRGLDRYFKGIYGSPTKKSELVSYILTLENTKNALMLGDAISDFEAAEVNEIDFIGYLPFSNVKESLLKLAVTNRFQTINTWSEII